MDPDTAQSGTRIFHQVKPSGRVDHGKVLKLVPGEPLQTHTPITSSVHVVSILSPQSKAPTVNRGQRKSPLNAPGQNLKGQIPQPFSDSTTIKRFLPSSPVKSTATAITPETQIHVTRPAQSKKTVVFVPKSKNVQIVDPHAPAEVNLGASPAQSHKVRLFPSSAHPAMDTIRTFSKIPRSTQTGCSPNQSREQSVISPAVASEALEVQWDKDCIVTQANEGETAPAERQPNVSMVMFDDKIFFRTKKKESKEGEVIDLCSDEVLSGGTSADEDGVTFVCYTPALAVSRMDMTGTCIKTAKAPGGSSTIDCTPAVSNHRDGHTPRGHNPHAQVVSSDPSPAPRPVADHKLKQMFGITSEVEIRLPRMTSCGTDINAAFQAPPLDYTEPIEEDFLCAAEPPHSQDCPQVEGSASRVGRTRKRTKCPCCSPAILHRYHRVQKRRTKPEHGERRETARRQLKLQPLPMTAPVTTAVSTSVSTSITPRKQAKLKPTQVSTSVSTSVSTPVSTATTFPHIPQKKTKLKPPPMNTPMTTVMTTSVTTPVTTPLTSQLTTPVTPQPVGADTDSEEMQIHKEIELLREALRLKEAALEKLKSDRNK